MHYDPQTVAEAMIGRDAEDFFRSELGQTLIRMSEQDAQECLEELATCEEEDRARRMLAKHRYTQAKNFKRYLIELYTRGQQAMKQMELSESEALDG